MRIYLAGDNPLHPSLFGMIPYRMGNQLSPTQLSHYVRHAPEEAHLMVDSGAFQAYNLGRDITREAYLAFMTEFRGRLSGRMTSLEFMTLDVVGDQRATWDNYEYFLAHSSPVVPIVTMGCGEEDILRVLKTDRFCFGFGGVIGADLPRVLEWFDSCYHLIGHHHRRWGHIPRIHLLGVSKSVFVDRYPAWSVDSSTWTTPARFGRSDFFSQPIPRRTGDPIAHSVTTVAVQAEIRRIRRLERRLTSLWRSRGITFVGDDTRS